MAVLAPGSAAEHRLHSNAQTKLTTNCFQDTFSDVSDTFPGVPDTFPGIPDKYNKVGCLGMRMLEWDLEGGREGHVDTFLGNHGDWQDLANLIFLLRGIFKLNFLLASPLLGQLDRGLLLSLKCSSCDPPDGKVQGVELNLDRQNTCLFWNKKYIFFPFSAIKTI